MYESFAGQLAGLMLGKDNTKSGSKNTSGGNKKNKPQPRKRILKNKCYWKK